MKKFTQWIKGFFVKSNVKRSSDKFDGEAMKKAITMINLSNEMFGGKK
jgi:hypothetical protein